MNDFIQSLKNWLKESETWYCRPGTLVSGEPEAEASLGQVAFGLYGKG